MKRLLPACVCTLALSGCSAPEPPDAEILKKEILQAEEAFEASAAKDGIAHAFYSFASDSAVIKRAKDSLIQGKNGIKNYYMDPRYNDASVTWTPDYIEVSNDGTLGYTYGKYVWKMKGDHGEDVEFTGVFHTVWKKQADGSWKYVWD